MEQAERECFEADGTDERAAEQNDILIPGLPNAIAILCIARVPRVYHHHMTGVSQSWRSLLRDRVFYEVRRELSLVEEWLYVWSRTAMDFSRDAWYCFSPSLKKWLKLPTMPHDDRVSGHSGFASMDGQIFVIGGTVLSSYNARICCVPCKTVSTFDTRSYCWRKVADLNVARAKCAAGLIDNQLYVFGGYTGSGFGESTTTVETYNPITNTWKLVSSMKFPMEFHDSVVVGGKFFVTSNGFLNEAGILDDVGYDHQEWTGYRIWGRGAVYDAKADKWENIADGLDNGWTSKTTLLNGKLYNVGRVEDLLEPQHIQVYNSSKDIWDTVTGDWYQGGCIDWFPHCARKDVEVVSLDGKLCIITVEPSAHELSQTESALFGTKDVVTLRILEIAESPEGCTYSVAFKDDLTKKIQLQPTWPLQIKKCQVVGL